MISQIVAVVIFHGLPAWSLIRWLPLEGRIWPACIAGLFFILAVLLIFGRDVAFLRDRRSSRILYRLSMFSFVMVLNLFLASLTHLLIRGIILIGGWNVPGYITLIPAFSVAFALVLLGLINARRLRVRTVEFNAPDFPESWRNRKILFFSDTHYGTLNGPGMAATLVSRIESLEPDLIICGGDLFDGPGGRVGTTLAILSRMEAPLGVLAVLGNHDYYYLTRPGSSRDLLERQRRREEMPADGDNRLTAVKAALPWRFLENESVVVDHVVFAGLRPFSLQDEARALEFLAGLDPKKPAVLINHKPAQIEEAAAAGIRLQLSGHTHGGPVFPVNLVMRKTSGGRHFGTSRHGGMILDTSAGSGISRWYPRTAGRHEVVVIRVNSTPRD